MRQIMPHRNNIAMHRTKCKLFFDRDGSEAMRSQPTRRQRTRRDAGFSRAEFDIVIQNNAL